MEIYVGEDLSNRRIVHSDGRQWPKVIVHHDIGMATIHDAPESTPWTTGLEAALSSGIVTDADLARIRESVKKVCADVGPKDGPFK